MSKLTILSNTEFLINLKTILQIIFLLHIFCLPFDTHYTIGISIFTVKIGLSFLRKFANYLFRQIIHPEFHIKINLDA